MKSIFKYTISLFLFVAVGFPAVASQYRDMQHEVGTYIPAFYQQNLESANKEQNPTVFLPDTGTAEKSFDEVLQSISDLSKKGETVSVDGILGNMLAPETLDELNRINTLVESGGTDDVLPETVTLNTMLASAAAFSPAIKSAEDNLRATSNRYEQAVFLDQLLLQYLGFTESLNTNTSSMKNQRMVQMNYPFPGMAALKGNAVDKDVEIARVEYEKTVRDILAEVRVKYADVLYFGTVLGITRQNLALARDIDKVVLRLYETGAAGYSSVVKISIRLDKLGTMEYTFALKRSSAITALRETVGLPNNIELSKFEETSLPAVQEELHSLQEKTLSQSQELRSMQLMIERMDIMIEMGGRKLFPDYTLGFSYFQNREVLSLGSQGKASNFMTRSMGPGAMPDFANENSYLQELRDKREAMSQKLGDMRNQKSSMAEMFFANYSASRNTSEIYETSIIGKARNAYEATLGDYTSGAGGFIDLLDAHRVLLDQELAYEDARRMARTSLALLEKTTGGRITVEKGAGSQ